MHTINKYQRERERERTHFSDEAGSRNEWFRSLLVFPNLLKSPSSRSKTMRLLRCSLSFNNKKAEHSIFDTAWILLLTLGVSDLRKTHMVWPVLQFFLYFQHVSSETKSANLTSDLCYSCWIYNQNVNYNLYSKQYNTNSNTNNIE